MTIVPNVRERARGISSDYVNALTWLHAYLDARTNHVPGVDVAGLGDAVRQNGYVRTYREYRADRPWAQLADGDTSERHDLDRAIAWMNEQLALGAFYEDDAAAETLYAFCRAVVAFIRGDGSAPAIPSNGHVDEEHT